MSGFLVFIFPRLSSTQSCGSGFIGIRIQRFDWIRIRMWIQFGSRVLMTKNWRKKIPMKIFLYQNCNLLTSKLQEKPSVLTREHQALQKMKMINFFLCFWVIFALLNPDTDPIRIRILIHSTASTWNLPQEKKEWKEVIEKRLLMPTFADEDTLLFPEDPLGRHGPR